MIHDVLVTHRQPFRIDEFVSWYSCDRLLRCERPLVACFFESLELRRRKTDDVEYMIEILRNRDQASLVDTVESHTLTFPGKRKNQSPTGRQ